MRTVNADVTEHFLKQGYYDMPTSSGPDNGRADNVVLREQESKLQERQTPLEICEMICD